MLDILAQGKKPEGAARRPTQTAQALAGYLLTLTSPKKLTLREAAAILDRDARSVKTAVGALTGYGVKIELDTDGFILFFPDKAAPIRTPEPELDFLEAPPIEGELVEFDAEFGLEQQESVEDQLSLFGGYYQTQQPKAGDYADFPIVAACSVRQPREQNNKIPEPETDAARADRTDSAELPTADVLDEEEPVRTDGAELPKAAQTPTVQQQTLCRPCANIAQGLRKDCTKSEKANGLGAAMEKLAATFDRLPNISTRTDAQARANQRNNQENNLNQRIKENKQEQSSIQCEQKFIFIPDKEKPPKVEKSGGRFDPAAWRRVDDEIARLAPNAADWLRHRIAGLVAWGGITEDEYEATIYPIKFKTSNIGNKGAYLNTVFEKFFKSRKWRKSSE